MFEHLFLSIETSRKMVEANHSWREEGPERFLCSHQDEY
uniref:Uncharacterized protein n=1 Tax=Rhizophora mucronata TaxID=61149 RepID=A0A2P2NF95_RHIMU